MKSRLLLFALILILSCNKKNKNQEEYGLDLNNLGRVYERIEESRTHLANQKLNDLFKGIEMKNSSTITYMINQSDCNTCVDKGSTVLENIFQQLPNITFNIINTSQDFDSFEKDSLIVDYNYYTKEEVNFNPKIYKITTPVLFLSDPSGKIMNSFFPLSQENQTNEINEFLKILKENL